jgi:hypothetical protein
VIEGAAISSRSRVGIWWFSDTVTGNLYIHGYHPNHARQQRFFAQALASTVHLRYRPRHAGGGKRLLRRRVRLLGVVDLADILGMIPPRRSWTLPSSRSRFATTAFSARESECVSLATGQCSKVPGGCDRDERRAKVHASWCWRWRLPLTVAPTARASGTIRHGTGSALLN